MNCIRLSLPRTCLLRPNNHTRFCRKRATLSTGITKLSTEFTVDALPAEGSPFHLAIPVHNLTLAREFYGDLLGLKEGRRDENKWQDYSLFGHQIVCHYVGENYRCQDYYNPVDGDEVPVPHFGIILKESEFHTLAQRIENTKKMKFIIPPNKRFLNQPGEQWTMFFKDYSNNNLEFKCMSNPNYLFARYNIANVVLQK